MDESMHHPSRLRGSAFIYTADQGGDIVVTASDFDLRRDRLSHPEQLPARRRKYRRRGRCPPTLPEDALLDEVVLIVGPTASKSAVLKALQALEASIHRDGLAVSSGFRPAQQTCKMLRRFFYPNNKGV